MKTRLVPWLAGGRSRLPLVAGEDLGQAFALAATADGLDDYESFNVRGQEVPTMKEVVSFLCQRVEVPLPWFDVPYFAGYAFGWLMEALHPLVPGSAPFLTRSLIHVAENWDCDGERARKKLGYVPRIDWRDAVDASVAELAAGGFPWPRLAQDTNRQLAVSD